VTNDFIEVNPKKLGGTPVFRGTRIPVYVLLDYFEEGYSTEEFLEQYDIDPDLAYGFLRALRRRFTSEDTEG